ncbi:MAG: PBP1A family penicillin-binding protein [Coriobacteriaceae bacterium]|nr:MAG: PBP1A family penicillin-binding protein [Coriobacteriaceae bacterium]
MGIRTRRARKHSKTHAVALSIAGIFGFIALLLIALAISGTQLVNSWLQDLPDYTSAGAYLSSEPTEIYDANNTLIAEFYQQNRRNVDENQISPYVLKGIVDTEDIRFYQHNGVDPQGILRAVAVQLGGGSEGGSTITQQLVRNTVLSDEQFDYSLRRKVREAYIAIQMEKQYTKDQILTMYLNTVYFGHSAYGIEAASLTYFNKHASDLTLSEAATLCGLPQSPSTYDPTQNYDAALGRRNAVLDHMLTAGDISQEEHDAAQAEPITINEGSVGMDSSGTYPYWTDYIRDQLSQDFDQDTIYKGGLRVYTTLDPNMQRAAETAVTNQISSSGNSRLDSALVAIDPQTGYIKAMVGGKDYNSDQFNVAAYGERQPGSSFKTITLTTAINQGMNPNIFLNCNSPQQVTPTWCVENYHNNQYGIISLARATELSSNTAYAQVAVTVGADNIVQTAKDLGIDEDIPVVPSITLGAAGVPPLQMAEAYATLASGGVHRNPVAITKIEDRNGNSVYEHQDDGQQVEDTSTTWAVTQVLEGVVQNGTAAQPLRRLSVNQPVAGKTGTSENDRDLWMIGYTPKLSVAVWCGYRNDNGDMVTINGAEGWPGVSSVPIFVNFLNTALANTPRQEFATAAAPNYKDNSSWSIAVSGGSASSNSRSGKSRRSKTSTTTSNNQDSSSTTEQTSANANATETTASSTTEQNTDRTTTTEQNTDRTTTTEQNTSTEKTTSDTTNTNDNNSGAEGD